MKVVITGARGLIGKEAIEPLEQAGCTVYSSRFDILKKEKIEEVFRREKPEYLLHFAWVASGDYLFSDANYSLCENSLFMLEVFRKYGGKRAVFAGTCFEYEFKDSPLRESDPTAPKTPYAKCKDELRQRAEAFALQSGVSFGWGRIFYVFGHGENERRLTPHVINSLKNGRKVTITNGSLLRDYMYTKDVAGAFVKFLQSPVEGCVNICTGEGISLEGYAGKIGKMLGKEELLTVKYEPSDQPLKIVGDNRRLVEEVGYKARYTLDEGLLRVVS